MDERPKVSLTLEQGAVLDLSHQRSQCLASHASGGSVMEQGMSPGADACAKALVVDACAGEAWIAIDENQSELPLGNGRDVGVLLDEMNATAEVVSRESSGELGVELLTLLGVLRRVSER